MDDFTKPILMQEREGKAGGGKGALMSDKAFSLRTSNFHTLFEPKSAFEENWAEQDTKNTLRAEASKSSHVVIAPTLSASNNPSRSPQSSEVTAQIEAMVNATMVVRRLTPIECERLQGFPDDWTTGQADSSRYKQMGNAVAVPVVNWIINRMVNNEHLQS